MAVVDMTGTGTAGISENTDLCRLIKETFDLSDYTIANATDTLQSLDLPAGFIMLGGFIEVTTVSTTSNATIDSVGYYGGTANAWHDSDISLTALALTVFTSTYAAYGYGTNHATADTLDLLLKTAAPADGIIVVGAYGFLAT